MFSVFEFIHGLIETPKFKKTVKRFLDELVYFLVLYMQITEDQVRIILLKYCMTLSPVSQEYVGVGVKREVRGGEGSKRQKMPMGIANQKELLVIVLLYTSTLCDWFKSLPNLLTNQKKRKLIATRWHFFPRFAVAACIC